MVIKESVLRQIIHDVICESEPTYRQMRKAANMNAWNPKSAAIRRASNGELTTVRMNKERGKSGA